MGVITRNDSRKRRSPMASDLSKCQLCAELEGELADREERLPQLVQEARDARRRVAELEGEVAALREALKHVLYYTDRTLAQSRYVCESANALLADLSGAQRRIEAACALADAADAMFVDDVRAVQINIQRATAFLFALAAYRAALAAVKEDKTDG
jgi:chromosome segregation ATPase